METNSPTGEAPVTTASTEPTVQGQEQTNPAEQVNQETSSGANTQGSVSDDTANTQSNEEKQTEPTGGESTTDDGLAKFAQSQGFDLEAANEDVKRALKIAHDNQKAFRSSGSKVSDAVKPTDPTDVAARIDHLEYTQQTNTFFEGKDRSLETKMAQILKEKEASIGKEYAYALSRDLDTLYTLAGGNSQASVDVEAIRRAERESINKQMSAGTPTAHATTSHTGQAQTVTQDWIANEYDPSNPEHIKLVDAFYSGR